MKLVIRIPKIKTPKVLRDKERVSKIKAHYFAKLPKFRKRDGKKHQWKCAILIPIAGYHTHTGKHIHRGLPTFVAWDIYKDSYYAKPLRIDCWTGGQVKTNAYEWYQNSYWHIHSVYDTDNYIIKEI